MLKMRIREGMLLPTKRHMLLLHPNAFLRMDCFCGETMTFFKCLLNRLVSMSDKHYSTACHQIKTRLAFALQRSTHLRIRGSCRKRRDIGMQDRARIDGKNYVDFEINLPYNYIIALWLPVAFTLPVIVIIVTV